MSDSLTLTTLPIYDIAPFTMIDFPDRTACIVWLSGCNMRCGYCHNPDIVRGHGQKSADDVLSFLAKRRGLLDGVVFSGGEASVWPGLPDLLKQVRSLGYAIKLDTNGLRPDIIRSFLEERLIDYVALDYKAPPEKFKRVTGTDKFTAFRLTLAMLCAQKDVGLEIRTTVHTALLDEDDVNAIVSDLECAGYTGTYYLQNFRADNDRPTLKPLPAPTRRLNFSQIKAPLGFQIDKRNF